MRVLEYDSGFTYTYYLRYGQLISWCTRDWCQPINKTFQRQENNKVPPSQKKILRFRFQKTHNFLRWTINHWPWEFVHRTNLRNKKLYEGKIHSTRECACNLPNYGNDKSKLSITVSCSKKLTINALLGMEMKDGQITKRKFGKRWSRRAIRES